MRKICYMLLVFLLVSCARMPASASTWLPAISPSPLPTNTIIPTDTPTPLPTNTLIPTSTFTPNPCSGATSRGARQKFTFEAIVPCLNTPQRVSQFMKNNITYDQKWDMAARGNEYAPAWLVYKRGSDDCDGHAILQCYFLEANGWDAYMIGLSIEGGGPGHNVCGVNLPDGRILVLDNGGFVEGYFNSLAEVARHYIAMGWMWEGGSLRTIRASQITQVTTDYTTPKVTDLPWSFHNY